MNGTRWVHDSTPRDRRWLWAVALAVVVVCMGWLTRGEATMDIQPPGPLAIERSTEVLDVVGNTPIRDAGVERRAVSWQQFPPAPLRPVVASPAVAMGSDVFVVGARDGRLAVARGHLGGFDASQTYGTTPFGLWETLPPSPLSMRSGPLLAATGEGLVVWGGTAGADGSGRVLQNGAVFSTRTETWEMLPSLPLPVGHLQASAWVARQLIVIVVADDGAPTRSQRMTVYSWGPGADAWQPLDPQPEPTLHRLRTMDAIPTASKVVVFGFQEGLRPDQNETYALGLDVGAGEWDALQALGAATEGFAQMAAAAAPSAELVALLGRSSHPRSVEDALHGVVIHAASGAWHHLPPSPPPSGGHEEIAPVTNGGLSGAWAGRQLFLLADGYSTMLRYDLETDRWMRFPPPVAQLSAGELVSTSVGLVQWGGQLNGRPVTQLWLARGSDVLAQ